MTVTLSKRPGKQQRGPPGRAYIPDRPPDGYHVTDGAQSTSSFAHLDHLAEIRRCLTQILKEDEQMTKLETRLDTLNAKLTDPDLLDEIPHDDPRRLEAEDLRDELTAKVMERMYRVETAALAIANHGRFAAAQGADLQTVDVDPDAVDRVRAIWPAILTQDGWRSLLASDCPF